MLQQNLDLIVIAQWHRNRKTERVGTWKLAHDLSARNHKLRLQRLALLRLRRRGSRAKNTGEQDESSDARESGHSLRNLHDRLGMCD